MAGKPRRTWTLSFTLAVLLHLALLATLYFTYLQPYLAGQSREETSAPGGTGGSTKTSPHPDTFDSETAAERLLADQQQHAAELTPQQREEQLHRRLKQLKDLGIDEQSVDRSAGLAERAAGVDTNRAWKPDPDATGPFDPESAVLYDIRKEQRDDGEVYVFVLVDRRGRSLQAVRRPAEMTDDDLRSYRMFRMGAGNHSLRRMLDSAIRIGQNFIDTP